MGSAIRGRSRALGIVAAILGLEGLTSIATVVVLAAEASWFSCTIALVFGVVAVWVAFGLWGRPVRFRVAGVALAGMQLVGIAIVGIAALSNRVSVSFVVDDDRAVSGAPIAMGLGVWAAVSVWMCWVLMRVPTQRETADDAG